MVVNSCLGAIRVDRAKLSHCVEAHGLSKDDTESLEHLDLEPWVLTLLGRDRGWLSHGTTSC